MHSRFRVLKYVLTASLAASGMAAAQTTPPADQATTQPAPAPTTTQQDQNVPANATPAGEAGGPSAGPKKSATEEIVVTGSRIRRKDLTTPAPVTVISREQVQSSGRVTVGDFLQTLPEQGNATNTQVNNGGDGSVNVSLRSLGAQRTLVLLDGKRLVASGGGNGGVTSSVDLTTIPTAAIERIEVLKDGASAVYGSDAIGGVVNIITRRKSNGFELSAYGGTSTHGDAEHYDFNASAGSSGENGSFFFNAGYYDQQPFFAAARDWAKNAVALNFKTGKVGKSGSFGIPQGNVAPADINGNPCGVDLATVMKNVDPDTGAPIGGYQLPSTPGTQFCTDILNGFHDPADYNLYMYDPSNPDAIHGWRPYGGGPDSYNYQAVNYLVTPSQRVQLFANGDRRLGDVARAYFQASYVNRQSSIVLAPIPLYPFNSGLSVSKDNYYNPFGTDIFFMGRRLVELGGREWDSDVDTYRVVTGIDGTLPEALGPAQGFFWDVSFNYGRSAGQYIYRNTMRMDKLAAAIGPSFVGSDGKPHCGTSADTEVAGCVPIDLFHGPGTITQDQLAGLTYTGVTRVIQQIAALEANLSGELFRLAAAQPVGIALGYQFRREFGDFVPNPIAAAGEDSDQNARPTKGSFNVNEGYAELSIPIVSDIAFAEQLEADAAVRVSNYTSFGTQGTYKFGGRWRPIHDITFRGTYSTGFRAPGVSDLYAGTGESYDAVTDPCARVSATTQPELYAQCGSAANNGDPQEQLRTLVGGNPKVQPETAKILTAGVVIEPSMVKNLSLTVDYYTVSLDNTISRFGAGTIMALCYPGAGGTPDPHACSLITRGGNNRVLTIVDTATNVGHIDTNGLDVALRYALPTEFGRFGFLFDGNILLAFDQTLADGTVVKGKGTYDLGMNPSFKANAGITYGIGGFNVGVNGRYVSPFRECSDSKGVSSGSGLCYAQKPGAANNFSRIVPDYTVFDLYAAYALNTAFGKTTFAAGVNNVFDRDPNMVYDNTFTFADPTANDFIGRFVYGRITQNF